MKEGDKSTAICFNCKGLTETTLYHRTISFASDLLVFEDVLVEHCDECHRFVHVPEESVNKIFQIKAKRAYERIKKAR